MAERPQSASRLVGLVPWNVFFLRHEESKRRIAIMYITAPNTRPGGFCEGSAGLTECFTDAQALCEQLVEGLREILSCLVWDRQDGADIVWYALSEERSVETRYIGLSIG